MLLWKSRPTSRIKPVIARDTTYSVSLLTCTISRSNFAIPSKEFRLTEMGRKAEESSQERTQHGVRPEVTWRPQQAGFQFFRRWCFLIRKPSARSLKKLVCPSFGVGFGDFREPGRRKPIICGGRSLDPPPRARQLIEIKVFAPACPEEQKEFFFSPAGSSAS